MNKTVRDILSWELYAAQRLNKDRQQSLEFAIRHRKSCAERLEQAHNLETMALKSQEEAAQRLKDLTDYLMAQGEGGITVPG
jgi:hypothetical protein